MQTVTLAAGAFVGGVWRAGGWSGPVSDVTAEKLQADRILASPPDAPIPSDPPPSAGSTGETPQI